MTTALVNTSYAEIHDWLSNVELAAIFDGGSVRLEVSDSYGNTFPAWLDSDGLWIDDESDPGYVMTLRGWRIERCY